MGSRVLGIVGDGLDILERDQSRAASYLARYFRLARNEEARLTAHASDTF